MKKEIQVGWLTRASYGGIFVFGIVMALLGAILPLLSDRIGFDLGRAGSLFLTMNCAMLLTMLGLGPLMDRFGKRPALAAGSLVVALALLTIAWAGRYQTLLAGVLLLGVGGGALNGATNTFVADLHTDERRKGAALNMLGVFFGFGALFLPFVIGSLLKTLGLAKILYLACGLSLVPASLFMTLRFPPPKHEGGFRLADAGRVVRDRSVLLLGFMLFFQSANEFIVGGYVSTYLVRDLSVSISTASYMLAAYWGSIMLARAVSSRLLLHVGAPALVSASAVGSAAGAALLVAARTEATAAFAVVVIGLSFASIFPTVLGVAGSSFETYSGTVFGVLFAIALTGGMVLPWVVGQVASAAGLRLALALVGVNSLMILVLQLLSLRRGKKASAAQPQASYTP